jgi:hypothetical protein
MGRFVAVATVVALFGLSGCSSSKAAHGSPLDSVQSCVVAVDSGISQLTAIGIGKGMADAEKLSELVQGYGANSPVSEILTQGWSMRVDGSSAGAVASFIRGQCQRRAV